MPGRRVPAVVAALACTLLTACSSAPISDVPSAPSSATSTTSAPASTASADAEAAEVDAEARRLAASLMVVGVTDYESARAALSAGAGGIFVVNWSDPGLLTEPGRDIHALRAEFGGDFEVSIDFEGGRVQRHSDVLGGIPAPRELAAAGPAEVRRVAFELGTRLRARGIDTDYAPLVDVDTAGLDIIGDRSFGTDPAAAAAGAQAFAAGLTDAGVRPVYKHFPGHGAASGDTHEGPAVTPPLDELAHLDLAAFGPAVAAAPPGTGVMVGHLSVPGLTSGETPASLDPAAYRLLRSGAYPGGVPFEGPIYTDDLSGMAAVSERATPPQAAARALAAGADRVLWSSGEGLDEAVDLVAAAVADGEIPLEQLRAAAARG
ncbi:glycoside hydrolase family 3 N-terminal domain-containing protein [Corynebacterium frankenforstense]|uniref:glycoside hydrolase family 3 N-terminal domain-containing protein n=1 Tax=Corynebacterium TaxID=1716 RepID=UPI00254BF05B|nr:MULTISPECIES: glycoside hydrolase family 3 N-terminal domain-containing protein [Corynebacterium]MDK6259481.1 glycoside hydrolase family 3 N-terminal domain-containing protein [Corynebacterium frankenforstense]MDK8895093.1 glycoside hydrolase family 3 N-terminal domain-containing protein [Corynebacterium sp. MSK006]